MSIYDKALKKLDEIAEDEAMTDGWEAYSIFWDWLESEAAEHGVQRTASQEVLARDWDTPEEDEAWAGL